MTEWWGIVACLFAIVVLIGVVGSTIGHPNAPEIRGVCARHGGLASVDVPVIGDTFVVCRDGYGRKL